MLLQRFWEGVSALASWLVLSPFSSDGPQQVPLGVDVSPSGPSGLPGYKPGPPIFRPPSGDPELNFTCDYTRMGPDWIPCSIPENRECWLRNIKTGEEFNIHTDYEKKAPLGIDRFYELDVADSWINADGINFTDAKLFDDKWPGRWIQACWGDTVHVKVNNNMKFNGTSIHWHGIRQNRTMHMDGVNGITQCPIAPKDSFTYVWKTTQYGSSWYHSHYTLQYADGMQGPLTIHGPTSAPYDEPLRPLLVTDWNHISSFQILNGASTTEQKRTILLNGRGNVKHFGWNNTCEIPDNYEVVFEPKNATKPSRAKRYLLRLINTSFASTFVFSIDHHWMQVVGSDFVPIEPYWNTSVLVGIGQRYHVIVEADPESIANLKYKAPDDGNFWIRTWVADRCGRQGIEGYEMTGIVRYNRDSKAIPSSQQWPDLKAPFKCSDETYSSLKPKIPWYVGAASNSDLGAKHGHDRFELAFGTWSGPPDVAPFKHAGLAFQREKVGFHPLRVNFSDPSFFHLNTPVSQMSKEWVMVPEDYTDTDWVYLVLTVDKSHSGPPAHPIHLHGHDFAVLAQIEDKDFDPNWEVLKTQLKFDNPPRRDVVLLPRFGFVIIAFKADNPGNWLMHCHIAMHASEGLAVQILERQKDSNRMFPKNSPAMLEAERVCDRWEAFEGDCKQWWPGINTTTGEYPACKTATKPTWNNPYYTFQEDSGI